MHSSPLAVPTYTVLLVVATSAATRADNVLLVHLDPVQCWHYLHLLPKAHSEQTKPPQNAKTELSLWVYSSLLPAILVWHRAVL